MNSEQRGHADDQRLHALLDVLLAELRTDDVVSLAMEIGAVSAPPRSSSASSRASFMVRPVVWKRLPNTPWMVATLMTFSSLMLRVDRLAVDFDGFAALLDEHHGHGLAEVGARGAEHLVAARAVERDVDLRAAPGRWWPWR